MLHQKSPFNPSFDEIRRNYLSNRNRVTFTDPKTGIPKTSQVHTITRQTWAGHSFSCFLIRLIEWLNISTVLETGTSLGINASYLSFADQIKSIYTIEGSTAIAEMARQLVQIKPGVKVDIIQGSIYEVFEETLKESQPELIFLDADHRSAAIRFYLDAIKSNLGNIKVIVIHDIYWSPDMMKAWKSIVNDSSFPLTVDCFNAGLVFPVVDMEKQHFILRNVNGIHVN